MKKNGELQVMSNRHPDEIMNDLDAVLISKGARDALGLMWEVVADVRSSYRLALEEYLTAEQRAAVEVTVDDYIGNHYSD